MKKLIVKLFIILSAIPLFATEFITFGTGEITGTYYPRGQFICNLINKYQGKEKIRCSIESTNGSVHNINSVESGEFNFAISQSDTINYAINSKKSFKNKKIEKLRSVISIYPELLTFIVSKKSNIKTIEDVIGKRINIGNSNSGSYVTTEELFDEFNIKKDSLKLSTGLNAEDTADALRDNRIDGFSFVVGHPAQNIIDSANSLPISILPIKGKRIDKFLEKNKHFSKAIIPANLYKGISKPIETIGIKAVIITSSDVSEKLVYNFVKIIFENFDEFKKSHLVYKNITKKSLLEGLGAQQHKGAKKYFKEINFLKKEKMNPKELRKQIAEEANEEVND